MSPKSVWLNCSQAEGTVECIAFVIGHTVRGFLYDVSPLDSLSITASLVLAVALAGLIDDCFDEFEDLTLMKAESLSEQ